MEKFELEDVLKDEIRARAAGAGFMKLVQSVRRNGKSFRISLRPVEIGGRRMFQAESCDDGRVQAKNLDDVAMAEGLEEIIAQKGVRDLHLMDGSGDLHVRVTRKGRVLVSRSREMDRKAEAMPHDRVKKTPLTSFDSGAFLAASGIAGGDGSIRASMRGKYNQVNEFLRVVGETLDDRVPESFTVVDCGCGKAYLTVALHLYLTRVRGFANVRTVGVDRRRDVVESARAMAAALGLSGETEFVESELSAYDAGKADMVVSLHACDTATDEALAKAAEWKAKYVLSAPCCQHELHKTLPGDGPFAGLLRHSILRERLGDLLTDAFRAQIMRILGYRTQVVEFVSSESTARNVMLKCVWGVKPAQASAVAEYLDLRDFWRVRPWLEGRMGERLSRILSSFE